MTRRARCLKGPVPGRRPRPAAPPPRPPRPHSPGPAGPVSYTGSATGGFLHVRGNAVRPELLPAPMHRHWLLMREAGLISPPIGWRPLRRGGTRPGGAVQAGLPRGVPSASGACGERRAPGGRLLGPGGARSAPCPSARVFHRPSPSFHFLFLPKGPCSVLPLPLRSHSAANSYSSFKTHLRWCAARCFRRSAPPGQDPCFMFMPTPDPKQGLTE